MCRRIGAILIALSLIAGLGGAYSRQEDEKAAALEKGTSLMESGEWKKAIKALKIYLRKYAESEEEKKEAGALLLRAEGEEELAAILKKYKSSSKIRSSIKSIRKFLEKYREDDSLMEKGEEFRETVRSQFVAMITDFEEDDWPRDDDGMSEVGAPEGKVKHGIRAARWKTGMGERWVHIDSKIRDWTPYTFFCFWIYNEKKPPRPGYLFIRPGYEGALWEHHFEYIVPIDFTGWREIRVEFAGKKGFGKTGSPDWSVIEEVQFYHPSDTGVAIDVIIDDVRLEKRVR